MSLHTTFTVSQVAGASSIKAANKAAKRLARRNQKGRKYANA